MEQLQKLTGVVEHLIYENRDTGYSVFEVNSDGAFVVVAGTVGEVCIGQTVEAIGRMEVHPNHGEQFKAQSCTAKPPEGNEAVLAYLSSGALPYVGPATAKKLIKMFGENTLQVIVDDPEQLTQLKGITHEKAMAISHEFRRMFGVQEVIAWLGNYQISAQRAVEVFRCYGSHTLALLTQNPYLLCSEPLYLKFAQADAIAASLRMEADSTLRVQAGILYALQHNAEKGHTCIPWAQLVKSTAAFIRLEPEQVSAKLEELTQEGEVECRSFDGERYVFLPDLLRAEEDIAAILAQRSHYPGKEPRGLEEKLRVLETAQGITYEERQREAIRQAMGSNLFVLTGGPGTGKTTVVNAILGLSVDQGDEVALCAPTGRAAKRMSEVTGFKATTIHRLLEVDYSTGTVRFIHNEKNLLKCSTVILDEMSMVDVKLFQALLLALRPSCRIILVGDADQLPSVGPGNVLGEIIASGVVPVVRLTEIFRQAEKSLIVQNAQRVGQGKSLLSGGKQDDFFVIERGGAACRHLICDLVCDRLRAAYGFDPIQEIQVLSPTKTGAVGTVELNRELQQRLNPPAPDKPQIELGERVFRLGDKVMQVRNNYDILFDRDDGEAGIGVYNGDIGIIVDVDVPNRVLKVKMDDRLVTYGAEMLVELEMAYAVTIHKSQGNEFPAVVIAAAEVPQKLCYRNLLYTGITRARKLCVIAGNRAVLDGMIANVRQSKRYSSLARLLRQEAGAD